MKLTKEIIDLIEAQTNCSVREYNDEFCIFVDNACDEDFEIEISKSENEIEEIVRFCDCFDVEEHFDLWRGANRGEPQNARVLLRNCEEIGENLTQLGDLLRGLN